MTVKLFHGDCMEILPTISDRSVDMVLCDLPYGTTRNKWDRQIPLTELWRQYERIVKPNVPILLFAQLPFDKLLAMSNPKRLRYEWVWVKRQGTGFLNAKKIPLKRHELILVFYEKLPKYHPQFSEGKPYRCRSGKGSVNYDRQKEVVTENSGKRYPTTILEFDSVKGLHPTQKPVALCEYLIKTYTDSGDTVLDNCMGSGTTGVALPEYRSEFHRD